MTVGSSFLRRATVIASVKRIATTSGGRRGTAATHIASIPVYPLVPIDDQTRIALNLNTPHVLQQTFTGSSADMDIVKGDTLVVGSVEYPIVYSEKWPMQSETRIRMIVEKLDD